MKYERKIVDDYIILSPEGRIDMSCSKDFESLALRYLQKKQNNLVINFSNTAYISSAGLRVILTATKEANAKNKKLFICGAVGNIQKVLDSSGFSTFLKIYDSLDDIIS